MPGILVLAFILIFYWEFARDASREISNRLKKP
jgi:hypothetical protein